MLKSTFAIEYHEKLQALTCCDEHLDFIEKIVSSNLVVQADKLTILNQVKKIKNRSLDPNFYLAVVGEFSSGKSSFINALLRDELLKTSALVTTAVATEIRFGKHLVLKTILNLNGKEWKLKTFENSKLITITALNIQKITIRELIHLLTSDNHLTAKINNLTISHPANFLKEGTVIIDTPGTNAINVEHGTITKQTIADIADAAVIIIPATTPLSQSLANFLDTSLRPFLHRCIFVVTKMDNIRKRERESLVEDLKNRLTTMLGLDNPDLLPISSQVVLDQLTLDEESEISSEEQIWLNRFQDLENFLSQKLRSERIIIIAENLLRLLTNILEQLEINLTQEWQTYEDRQLALKNNIIQDLGYFTSEHKNKYRSEIEQAIQQTQNQLNSKILEYQEQKKQQIKREILTITDWDELKVFTENGAESILGGGQPLLQRIIETQINDLNNKHQKAQENFLQEFSQEYKKLEALGNTLNVSNHITSQALAQDTGQIFSEMKELHTQQENEAAGRVMTGIAVGIIGSILIPGVGALLGGIIGASVSRWLGPSLEERKNDLWFKLEPSLNSYFQDLKKQIQNEITTHGYQLINSLEEHIDLYMNKYKSVVDIMLLEQQEELNRLNELQINTETYLKEIARRKKQIEQQKTRLI
ncbi:MAG: Dynamin family protein [Gloeocapsa sp. DLM2.Bin57]|nr:MAG: Dynamin family protein [Gloeocapsa sp. DLM2.Bin57]